MDTVSVRLTPEDRLALQLEALRRVQEGAARRLDVSAIIRDLIRSGLPTRAAGR